MVVGITDFITIYSANEPILNSYGLYNIIFLGYQKTRFLTYVASPCCQLEVLQALLIFPVNLSTNIPSLLMDGG